RHAVRHLDAVGLGLDLGHRLPHGALVGLLAQLLLADRDVNCAGHALDDLLAAGDGDLDAHLARHPLPDRLGADLLALLAAVVLVVEALLEAVHAARPADDLAALVVAVVFNLGDVVRHGNVTDVLLHDRALLDAGDRHAHSARLGHALRNAVAHRVGAGA